MMRTGGQNLKHGLKHYFENISHLPFNKWEDGQILLFHSYVHREFEKHKSASFIDLHTLVYEEMKRRSMKHNAYDDLDLEVKYD